jgi:hypothetical protein
LLIVTGSPVSVTARTKTAAGRACNPIEAVTVAFCAGKGELL